jgi:hypothetical protein
MSKQLSLENTKLKTEIKILKDQLSVVTSESKLKPPSIINNRGSAARYSEV